MICQCHPEVRHGMEGRKGDRSRQCVMETWDGEGVNVS